MPPLSLETDVFVVGGGPAGLAAAIAARQQGLRVMLADPGWPPIDKACGEGLMPNGVAALQALGVSVAARDGMPFRGIRFIDTDVSAEARFTDAVGLGVRRTTLHGLLATRAVSLGAAVSWGTRVRNLTPAGVILGTGDVVACRWVIAADGERSPLRRQIGLAEGSAPVRRHGFRRHFRIVPWTDVVEVYWCVGAQVVVTPVGPSEVCIGMMSRDGGLRLDDVFRACPALGQRLKDALPTTRERGEMSTSHRLDAVVRGRRALIGEASGSVDAITGAGLSMLFHQALALGDALARDDLDRYQVAHRRIARMPRLLGRLMLGMDRYEGLRRRALRTLEDQPSLFARLLALHVGAIGPAEFGVHRVCDLGWRLLTA